MTLLAVDDAAVGIAVRALTCDSVSFPARVPF
jgi:hypothetical protein